MRACGAVYGFTSAAAPTIANRPGMRAYLLAKPKTERKRGSGRKPNCGAYRKMEDRLKEDPQTSIAELAAETKMSKAGAHRAVRVSLGMKPLKIPTCARLTSTQKEKRVGTCRKWLHIPQTGKMALNDIVWSDEKIPRTGVTIKEKSTQNCRTWVKNQRPSGIYPRNT